MKKIKLTLEIECSDSTHTAYLISDLEDGLLSDNVKKTTIEYTEDGVLRTEVFENEDFEEQ